MESVSKHLQVFPKFFLYFTWSFGIRNFELPMLSGTIHWAATVHAMTHSNTDVPWLRKWWQRKALFTLSGYFPRQTLSSVFPALIHMQTEHLMRKTEILFSVCLCQPTWRMPTLALCNTLALETIAAVTNIHQFFWRFPGLWTVTLLHRLSTQ